MRHLFRAEVAQARTSSLGVIRIGRNPSFTAAAMCSLAMLACVAAYGVLGEVSRKTRLSGVLVPVHGTLSITTPVAGTVSAVHVREGDALRPRQPLLVIKIDRATSTGDTAAMVAQTLQQRQSVLLAERSNVESLARQRQHALVDRGRSLESESRQFESEIVALRGRLSLASKTAERFAELGRSGFVSQVQVQQKEEERIDASSRLGAAERSLLSLRRDAGALQSEQVANAGTVRSQLAQIDQTMAALEQERTENLARRELVVEVPEAATVTALNVHKGQWVQPGQVLVSAIPVDERGLPSDLQAQLFAPSRAAGFVEPGQTVWMRFAAYPFQKFGMAKGRIESVSRTPVSSQDLPAGQGLSAASGGPAEPFYRIVVSLDSQTLTVYGRPQTLKAGLLLEADAVQDHRRIWEWILEPVLAASGLGKRLSLD